MTWRGVGMGVCVRMRGIRALQCDELSGLVPRVFSVSAAAAPQPVLSLRQWNGPACASSCLPFASGFA